MLLLFSCGGGEGKKKESKKIKIGNQPAEKKATPKKATTKPSETIDLNK